MHDWFRGVDSTITVGFMAGLLVSILKVVRDKRKITISDIAEGLICAIMTVGAVGVLAYWLKVNGLVSVGIGAFIGSIGSKIISELALSWFNSKKDKAP